ncbi:MAG: alanine/ornithine racemase family PLP-dependent enzyme [Tenericutes bacterium]|nr:alanine/ornithine racemase family PLP-dependent enzyme [Mycoplasmatota bacterium]
MYPRIIINQKKLVENANTILDMARNNNIPYVTTVVKAFAGDVTILSTLKEAGIKCIGDSRLQNLKLFKHLDFRHKMLLRIPMISEVDDVIRYSDISLNSELSVIKALNKAAKEQNKKHDILIMFDLGDLREGIYYKSDYISIINEILKLDNILIRGIGTNLTCYGGLVPSKEIFERLITIKLNIENSCGIKLEIISGGNSSSVTLFDKNIIPKEINHLRLGESILFGKETSYSTLIEGLHHDVFSFEAEIIELKDKPSYPDGEISINSFGLKPDIEDKGNMKRAILAIGKQDTILSNLKPLDESISIIGGSSDHLILDVTKGNYKIGDVIAFKINYPALVHLMNSNYIAKLYK